MQEITVTELKQKIENKEDFQLIDVREAYEYEIANIGGELIPLSTVTADADKIRKDIPVIVMCRSGARSAMAISELSSKFGLSNLFNLKGGILAYANEIDPSLTKY